MANPRSRSYICSTAKVLNTEPVAVHTEIARLAVLYEDLRLEIAAASEAVMPKLDVINARHRKTYFLRRAIATLREFGEAIRFLEGLPEFKKARKVFDDSEAADWWNSAVRFFKEHSDYLQRIRNDFGGHFSRSASRYAITHVDPSVVSSIEIEFKDHKATAKAFFVAALADEAMLRRRGQTSREACVGARDRGRYQR